MRRWIEGNRKSRRGTFVWGRSIPGGIARLPAVPAQPGGVAANEGRDERAGVFALRAAPPGRLVATTAPAIGAPARDGEHGNGEGAPGAAPSPSALPVRASRPPQPSALIRLASAKSNSVSPPAECVDSVSVTLFHWIRMSGW